MANPVSVSDLEARFRPLNEDEKSVAWTLLDDAWAILLVNRPGLEDQLAAVPPAVSVDIVRFVVSSMVLRVLRNPDGIRQWSVDDASFTRDGALSTGGLYVSPDELGLLSTAGGGSGAAFTITPGNDGPGYRTDAPSYLAGWS